MNSNALFLFFVLAMRKALRYVITVAAIQQQHNTSSKANNMFTATQAQAALAAHNANANSISANSIAAQLNTSSVTFAQLVYVTQVKTAAAHKHVNVQKVTCANVQLFSNINAATSVFANAVKRSAANIADNAEDAVAAFTAQSNYFAHNAACYSLVAHKQNNKQYLYCIYNNAQSYYFIDNVLASKAQVAALLTNSAAQAMLNPSATVVNATHNIQHNVVVRTIALASLCSITCNKQVNAA